MLMSSSALYLVKAIVGSLGQKDRNERRALVRVLNTAAAYGAKLHGKDLQGLLQEAYSAKTVVGSMRRCDKCLEKIDKVMADMEYLADNPIDVDGKSWKKDSISRLEGARALVENVFNRGEC